MLICLYTSAGGYIPSSSAADDYMAQLKGNSRRKNREQRAMLSGREIPAEGPGASGDEVRTPPELKKFGVTYNFVLSRLRAVLYDRGGVRRHGVVFFVRPSNFCSGQNGFVQLVLYLRLPCGCPSQFHRSQPCIPLPTLLSHTFAPVRCPPSSASGRRRFP